MKKKLEIRLPIAVLILLLGGMQIARPETPLAPSSVPGISVPEGYDAEIFAEGLGRPSTLAVESDGNVLVGRDCNPCPIFRLSSTGEIIASSSDFDRPLGVEVDSGGRVFVTVFYDRTVVIAGSLDGGKDILFGPAIPTTPAQLAIDSADTVFVVEGGGQIYEVTETSVTPFATTSGGSGLQYDPVTGGLLAASFSSGDVSSISPEGAVSVIAVTAGGPAGAALDPGGLGEQLFVNLYTNGEVVTVDRPTGNTTPFASGFAGPHDVAFTALGELLVAEYDAGRIIKIFPTVPVISGSLSDDTLPVVVICLNSTTGQSITLEQGGSTSWNCTTGGLLADAGDSILQIVAGAASCPIGENCQVGGQVSGVDGQFALCLNRTTSQAIPIPLGGGTSWDCTAAGLGAVLGNTIIQVVSGAAVN